MKSTTPAQIKQHQKLSQVPKGRTIMKTNLKRHYRLSKEFLNDVLLQRVEEWEITKSDETTMVVDMFLYWEQDAEFQAWKMHGGREGFLEYLYELRCRWERQHKGKEFPVSDWYWHSLQSIWNARKDEREKAEAEAAAKAAARQAKREAREARKAGVEVQGSNAKGANRAAAVKAETLPAETPMELPSEGETKPARSPTGVVRRNARQQRVAARNSTQ